MNNVVLDLLGSEVCTSAFLKKIHESGETSLSPFGWWINKKGTSKTKFLG